MNFCVTSGHDYEIYPTPKTPEINMHFYVRDWLTFYEREILGRPILPEEFIFPSVASNGLVDSTRPADHAMMLRWLNEFAAKAGLDVEFSFHCFRRGGPQYRLMHCPLGERWSLTMIRWWGGWAEGEQVRTIFT